MKWTLHFDPWNIRASDLGYIMYRIHQAFTQERTGWLKYKDGTDINNDYIVLEYDDGNVSFWLCDIDYEDIPRMLAMLSPYDIKLVEIKTEFGDHKEFDRFGLYGGFADIVMDARKYFLENKDEVASFKRAWEEFCERNSLSDEWPEE